MIFVHQVIIVQQVHHHQYNVHQVQILHQQDYVIIQIVVIVFKDIIVQMNK